MENEYMNVCVNAKPNTIILQSKPDEVTGGYADKDGVWHDFGGEDTGAIYLGKTFKARATITPVIGSSYTYIPVFATSTEANPGPRAYVVFIMTYATGQTKVQFVNSHLASPPSPSEIIDNTATRTTYGETFQIHLDYGIPSEYKDWFDALFEEVVE